MFPPALISTLRNPPTSNGKLIILVAVVAVLISLRLWLGVLDYRASLMDCVTLPGAHLSDGEIPWERTLAINVRCEFEADAGTFFICPKIEMEGIEVRSVDELTLRVNRKRIEMDRQGRTLYLLLRADGRTPYTLVREILQMCEQLELTDIGIAVTPRP